MPVTPVGASAYFGDVAVKKKSELSMENFMHLLTVQLQNQNPLEPMNDRDFFAQMAQLGQVQGMDTLNKSLDVTKAQALMGKQVTASRPNGELTGQPTVTGVVKQLTYKDGQYKIGIQEPNGGIVEVDMKALQSVEPTTDITDLQSLIGKIVSGPATVTVDGSQQTAFVEGKVLRVFSENGQRFARLHLENGQDVDLNINDVRSIAPGS